MNQDSIPPAGDSQEEIAALIRQLHETEERLGVLTEGKVDSVVHPSGASYLLHRAQGELLKSEAAKSALSALHTSIFDALPAHVALLDENGIVVAVNDAWRGFGSNNVFETTEYGIGRNYIQICDEAHGECAKEAHQVGEGIKAVLRGEIRSFSLEYPCHSPTQRQWFRVMVTPLHKSGAGGAVIMHVNVSERRLAEEAVRESHEKFNQLASNITDVFWIRSADMREVHYVSPAFEKIWGRPVSSLYENPAQWIDFVMSEDRARVTAAFEGLMGEEQELDIEYRIMRPDGEVRWVRVRGFKVRDEAGKIIRYAGIVTDITERKKVEAELASKSETLVSVTEALAAYVEKGDWRAAMGRLLDCALKQTQSEYGFIGVVMGGSQLRVLAHAGIVWDKVLGRDFYEQALRRYDEVGYLEFTNFNNLFGRAITTGEVVIANAPRQDPRSGGLPPGHPPMHSFMGVPIAIGKQVNGLVALGNRPGGYCEEDQYLIETLVRHAGGLCTSYQQHEAARHIEQKRSKAEEALRASESSMAAAQRIAHFGSWELDLANLGDINNNPLRWSDEMYRIAGYEPGAVEVTNELFFQLVPAEDHRTIQEAVAQAIQEKRPYSIVHRLIRPGGEVRIVHETAQLFLDESTGSPVRMIGTAHDITEQRKAEEALRRSEMEQRELVKLLELERARLVAAQRVAKVGSWETNLTNLTMIWSAETYRIFEADPATFVPTHAAFLNLVHPEDREIFDRSFMRSIEQRSACIIEHRLLLPDGRIKHVEERWQVFRDDQQKPERAIGTCQDITERKHAEHRAAEEHLFNQTLIETSPLAIITYRASGEGVGANAASMRMLGAPDINTVQSQNFREIKFWQETGLLAAADKALASGQPQELEARGRNSFGKEMWIHCRLKPFTYSGQPYLLCFFDDIRERKRAEEKLAEQAALLDIAHEAIFVKELDSQIIYWNKGAERIYGWTAAEALGRNSTDLVYKDPKQFRDAFAILITKGEWHGEMNKIAKNGRELTVEVRWTLVRDEAGTPKSILAINSDVTEKKKLEAQFLRAQRMESIGTLAGGIAHDLNNVLAPIMMSVEMLKEMVNVEEGQKILETLQGSAQRGADLVKQVLTFARGVEGQRMDVNLSHQLKEIQKVVQETFPKNIQTTFDSGRGLWPVTGDPTQLHQVCMNLLVNARDAMPNGGKLEVSAENVVIDEVYAGMNPDSKPGSFVMIKVVDEGTGIAPEIRDRIFEPFFTTKPLGKGTGLGLSTVSAIVRSHGGFIHLYSEIGKGSRFKVYLPAKASTEAIEAQVIEQTRLPLGNGERILVVDDEEGIREVARKLLERFGYKVYLAANGAEAVALYAQHRSEIAAVITDMAMPVMDGPATIIALQAMEPKIKIIGSSGHASNGGVAKALGAGVQHFIPKPYTAEKMLTVLAEVLKERA